MHTRECACQLCQHQSYTDQSETILTDRSEATSSEIKRATIKRDYTFVFPTVDLHTSSSLLYGNPMNSEQIPDLLDQPACGHLRFLASDYLHRLGSQNDCDACKAELTKFRRNAIMLPIKLGAG